MGRISWQSSRIPGVSWRKRIIGPGPDSWRRAGVPLIETLLLLLIFSRVLGEFAERYGQPAM
ncbi:MAG TPA: hypothetical protein VGZ29_09945, partial [Terriglobia bacterium]|nr:hypothetical protein [Terriglobia bacterium]